LIIQRPVCERKNNFQTTTTITGLLRRRTYLFERIYYISPQPGLCLYQTEGKPGKTLILPNVPRLISYSHRDHATHRYHDTKQPAEYMQRTILMNPHHTNNAQLQNVLQILNNIARAELETEDMPAPPAYHTIVDPTLPLPNMRNPYDPEDDDEEEVPEITINAATQVRGNGNIISIAQMDSVRIANLIAVMLKGETASQSQSEPQTLPSLASMTKPLRQYPRINITVNCGATVIGDRNIVGPGLGDIARQMRRGIRRRNRQRGRHRRCSWVSQ
jgi:hypothetical protein